MSSSTTPWVIPPARRGRKDVVKEEPLDPQILEMQRLEELLKKHYGHGWTSLEESIRENLEFVSV